MRRSVVLLIALAVGCGSSVDLDADATPDCELSSLECWNPAPLWCLDYNCAWLCMEDGSFACTHANIEQLATDDTTILTCVDGVPGCRYPE